MKTNRLLFLILLPFLLSQAIFAQNVGIGTVNPQAKLDVNGTIKISDGTEDEGKVLTSDTSGLASWQTLPAIPWTVSGNDISNDNSGNVGIGTTSPGSKLQVGDFGLPGNQYLKVASAGGNSNVSGIKLRHFSDDYGFTIESDDKLSSQGLNFLRHSNNSTGESAMFIDMSGNVGIDETAPSEKLEVNGRIKAKGYKNTIYQAGGSNAGNVILSGNNWQDVPNLSVTFTLEEATTVIASYTISTYLGQTSQDGDSNDGYSVTRIMIDGTVVNKNLMGINDGAQWEKIYHNHNGTYFTELAAGTHTIKIQYRTNVTMQCHPGSDHQNRFLQVLVFGSN